MKGIEIFDSFLDNNESKTLLDKLKLEAVWEQAAVGRYENDKISHSEIDLEFRDIEVSNVYDTAQQILNDHLSKFKTFLDEKFEITNYYFGEFMFSKYKLNSHIKPHSDTGIYSTNRLMTCVLYLNEEFEGGELYFPDFGYEYKPKQGDIISFWSEYSHGVKKLTNGERYCVVFFARSYNSTGLFK